MTNNLVIRRASAHDVPAIAALVRAVVLKVCADLAAANGAPPKGDPARWAKARVADEGALEHKNAQAGFAVARLGGVKTNGKARRFYMRFGWREARPYPHECGGHEMVECNGHGENAPRETIVSRLPAPYSFRTRTYFDPCTP